jgi:hypothetical protein
METETTVLEETTETQEETESNILPTIVNVVAAAATVVVAVRTVRYVKTRIEERRAEKAVLNNLNNLPTEQ